MMEAANSTHSRVLPGIALAPAAWAAQEGLSAFASARACDLGHPMLGRAIVVALGGVALAVTVGVALSSLRTLRQVRRGNDLTRLEGRDTQEFLALIGLTFGVVLSCAVVWATLPMALIKDLCEARR